MTSNSPVLEPDADVRFERMGGAINYVNELMGTLSSLDLESNLNEAKPYGHFIAIVADESHLGQINLHSGSGHPTLALHPTPLRTYAVSTGYPSTTGAFGFLVKNGRYVDIYAATSRTMRKMTAPKDYSSTRFPLGLSMGSTSKDGSRVILYDRTDDAHPKTYIVTQSNFTEVQVNGKAVRTLLVNADWTIGMAQESESGAIDDVTIH